MPRKRDVASTETLASLDGVIMADWLVSTAEKRAALLAYARSPLPTDPGERQLDISKALEAGQDGGDLLADADSFLLQEEAAAVLWSIEHHPDLRSDERKVVAKARTAELNRLRDGLAVLYRTLKDRRFSLMSVGRWEA